MNGTVPTKTTVLLPQRQLQSFINCLHRKMGHATLGWARNSGHLKAVWSHEY